MFKIVKRERVWWPVTVSVPVDGGRTQKHVFEAEFALLTQAQIDARMQGPGAESDEELLVSVVLDWREVQDEHGEALACTDDAKRRMFAAPYVRAGAIHAFFEANAGKAAARKN